MKIHKDGEKVTPTTKKCNLSSNYVTELNWLVYNCVASFLGRKVPVTIAKMMMMMIMMTVI